MLLRVVRQLLPVGQRIGLLPVPEGAHQATQQERLLEKVALAETVCDAAGRLRCQAHLGAQTLAGADHVAPGRREPVGDRPDGVHRQALVVARFRDRQDRAHHRPDQHRQQQRLGHAHSLAAGPLLQALEGRQQFVAVEFDLGEEHFDRAQLEQPVEGACCALAAQEPVDLLEHPRRGRLLEVMAVVARRFEHPGFDLEVPQNRAMVESRHPYVGFTVYAPAGSVARGEDLVVTGASGKTVACSICHGEGLTGLGDVPRLAGLSPLYVVRQLYEFQIGDRTGSLGALMNASVANLTEEDIVDIAAYLATLDP